MLVEKLWEQKVLIYRYRGDIRQTNCHKTERPERLWLQLKWLFRVSFRKKKSMKNETFLREQLFFFFFDILLPPYLPPLPFSVDILYTKITILLILAT